MNYRIIAAVRDENEFESAIKSKTDVIFYLYPDLKNLEEIVDKGHKYNKKIFIHIDLTSGLGKDKSGIEFAKQIGIDGIISTRANLIKYAKEAGIVTVQRFFIVDTRSVDTSLETLKNSKADMIEVMPGCSTKIIKILKEKTDVPIIAGGLIDSDEEVKSAIQSGAYAISTGKSELWER